MKLNKKTFILLIMNIIILPLLGNENLLKNLHIQSIATVIYYILPGILFILLAINYIKNFKNRKKTKIEIFEIILFTMFWIFLSFSFIFSIVKEIYTVSNFIKLTLCMFFVLLIPKLEITDKQKKIIDYSIISLLIYTSILGIFQYIFKFDITTAGVEKYPGAIGRVKSTFYIATIFDKYLLVSLLYSIYLLFKKRINIIINIIAFILGNIALIFTFCRSSLIIILAIYFILFIYFIIKKKYIISTLIVLTLIITYFIPGQKFLYSSVANYFKNFTTTISEKTNITLISNISNLVLDRFIIKIEEDKLNNNKNNSKDNDDQDIDIQLKENIDYSLESRSYFKKIGTYIIKSNPILGIGVGSYTYIYENQNATKYIKSKYVIDEEKIYMYPHNMYIQLAAEIGIIASILFFLIIIVVLLRTKNIFCYLLLLTVLLSCYSESIFYMKDVAYFTIFIIGLFCNKSFIEK